MSDGEIVEIVDLFKYLGVILLALSLSLSGPLSITHPKSPKNYTYFLFRTLSPTLDINTTVLCDHISIIVLHTLQT